MFRVSPTSSPRTVQARGKRLFASTRNSPRAKPKPLFTKRSRVSSYLCSYSSAYKCNEKTILERAWKNLLASKLRFKKRRFARHVSIGCEDRDVFERVRREVREHQRRPLTRTDTRAHDATGAKRVWHRSAVRCGATSVASPSRART